jgi:hypothetical protein
MNNTDFGQPTNAPLADTYRPVPAHLYGNASAAYPVAASYPAAVPQPVIDPGRTLGVVGLVLSIFASAIGLVVSAIAYRKSKQAGFRNGAALAGIVVGLITTLALLTSGILSVVAATSLLDTCRDLGPGEHVVNGVTYTC